MINVASVIPLLNGRIKLMSTTAVSTNGLNRNGLSPHLGFSSLKEGIPFEIKTWNPSLTFLILLSGELIGKVRVPNYGCTRRIPLGNVLHTPVVELIRNTTSLFEELSSVGAFTGRDRAESHLWGRVRFWLDQQPTAM
jgi:hypothetical protein